MVSLIEKGDRHGMTVSLGRQNGYSPYTAISYTENQFSPSRLRRT